MPHADQTRHLILATRPTFGCDPELFIESGGQIVESSTVVEEGGIRLGTYNNSKIVRDGVQVELNPEAGPCRAELGNEISRLFRKLRDTLRSAGAQPSFKSVITLSDVEMERLSDASKVLGCARSKNLYNQRSSVNVGKDFRTRSAGGHIHLGVHHNLGVDLLKLPKWDERLVALLDILVGNTCVLIDRDPMAAERRKTYGRAGEYRLPTFGLEYRVLSNFWLRAYPLMSFVTGMSRLAVNILVGSALRDIQMKNLPHPDYVSSLLTYDHVPKVPLDWDWETELLSVTSPLKIRKAINTNDLTLAQENWKGVKNFIDQYVIDSYYPLNYGNMEAFEYFAQMVQEKGLEYWFPNDPMTEWCELDDGHGNGWESFLFGIVVWQMRKAKAA